MEGHPEINWTNARLPSPKSIFWKDISFKEGRLIGLMLFPSILTFFN